MLPITDLVGGHRDHRSCAVATVATSAVAATGGESHMFVLAIAVGGVARRSGCITLHGIPEYAGSAADAAARRTLWTEHTLDQTRLETRRAERDAARRSVLDEALAPLLELTAPLRPGGQLGGSQLKSSNSAVIPYRV